MASEPKTTEPGFFKKLLAKYRSANLEVAEEIGGKDVAAMAAQSFDAIYERGNIVEGVRIGWDADKKVAGQMYDKAKAAFGTVDKTIQHGNLKAMEFLGGKEAADLTAKAFEAGDNGHPVERTQLALKAEAMVPGHLYDELKAVITGGHDVKEHGGAPATTSAKPVTRDTTKRQ